MPSRWWYLGRYGAYGLLCYGIFSAYFRIMASLQIPESRSTPWRIVTCLDLAIRYGRNWTAFVWGVNPWRNWTTTWGAWTWDPGPFPDLDAVSQISTPIPPNRPLIDQEEFKNLKPVSESPTPICIHRSMVDQHKSKDIEAVAAISMPIPADRSMVDQQKSRSLEYISNRVEEYGSPLPTRIVIHSTPVSLTPKKIIFPTIVIKPQPS